MASVELDVALTGLLEAAKDVQSFTKKADDNVSGLKAAFSSLKTVAIAALAGVTFKEIIEGAIESDRSVSRLAVTMKLAGDFSKQGAEGFKALASEIQRSANISDELVTGLITNAKAIGLTNDQTVKLTRASADLAAVLGQDVQTTFSDLEKTLSGKVSKSLAQRFPELKQLSIEALANGEAIKLLGDRYSGAANQLNRDFGGNLTGIKIGLGEIFESIGKVITQNPLFVAALGSFKDILFDIADAIEGNVGNAIDLTNAAFKSVAGVILDAVDAYAPYLGALKEAGVATFELGETLVSILIPAFKFLVPLIQDLGKLLLVGLGEAVSFVVKGIRLFNLGLLELARGFNVLRGNTDAVAEIDARMKSLVQTMDGQDTIIKENAEAIKAEVAVQRVSVELIGEQAKAQKDLATATVKASDERRKAIQQEIDQQNLQIARAKESLIQSAASNPLQFARRGGQDVQQFRQTQGVTDAQANEAAGQAQLAQGLGIGALAFQGQAGAQTLITGALGAFADTLLPGIGGIVSQVAGVLAQGPEAAKKFIEGFVEGIPTIIENIILAIPAVIEALQEKIPELVSRLIQEIPGIAIRVGIELGNQAPFIATKMAAAIVAQAPEIAKGLVQGIVDALKEAIGSLGGLFGGGGGGGGGPGGILGGIGGAIGGIGDVFGFAEGGVVPGGPPFVDKVPAVLTPGEEVLSRSTSDKLDKVLAMFASGGSGGPIDATIIVQVGDEALARTMVRLNQRGHRLA